MSQRMFRKTNLEFKVNEGCFWEGCRNNRSLKWNKKRKECSCLDAVLLRPKRCLCSLNFKLVGFNSFIAICSYHVDLREASEAVKNLIAN